MKKLSFNKRLSDLVIGISGINATDNPGPGVPVARSLKEGSPDSRLVGLSYDPHDPGNYMTELLKHTTRMPFPSKGWSEVLKKLHALKQRFGLNMLIPSLDAELPLFIAHQKELKKIGIQTLLPTEEQFLIREKKVLAENCSAWGFLHPKTFVVHSVDQLIDLLKDESMFPCYIKGNYYKAYLVHHLSQAILRFTEIADEWGLPILVQKPVLGKEVNLVGLGDGAGNACGMMVAKKLTTTSLGKFWTGVSMSHPKLLELGEQFVQQTKWRGPFELECMETESGIVLIEINPRFPAWVYFATGCGLNLPLRLAQLVTFGDCPTHSQYEVGKLFVRYTSEIVTDLSIYSSLMMDGGWKDAA